MADVQFTFYPDAMDELMHSEMAEEIVGEFAAHVRTKARANAIAADLPQASRAIAAEVDSDAESAYGDVGYTKTQPGIIAFQNEVGNFTTDARPHLRPALTSS